MAGKYLHDTKFNASWPLCRCFMFHTYIADVLWDMTYVSTHVICVNTCHPSKPHPYQTCLLTRSFVFLCVGLSEHSPHPPPLFDFLFLSPCSLSLFPFLCICFLSVFVCELVRIRYIYVYIARGRQWLLRISTRPLTRPNSSMMMMFHTWKDSL